MFCKDPNLTQELHTKMLYNKFHMELGAGDLNILSFKHRNPIEKCYVLSSTCHYQLVDDTRTPWKLQLKRTTMADISLDQDRDQTPPAVDATEGNAHLSKERKMIIYRNDFPEVQQKYYDVDQG